MDEEHVVSDDDQREAPVELGWGWLVRVAAIVAIGVVFCLAAWLLWGPH